MENPRTTGALAPAATPAWARFWLVLVPLLALGAAVHFAILAEYLAKNPLAHEPRVDALTYWNWAGRIAAGQLSDGQPFFSAPLYPYLLGVLRSAGGGLAAVYVCQILLDLVAAGLLAWIGRRRFGPAVGLLAAAVYLLMIEPASFSLRVLTSTVQIPLICLAWLMLLRLSDRGRVIRALCAGAALGLAALAYPPALYALPLAAAWSCWNAGWKWRGVALGALVLLAGLAVISPATIHNYRTSGELFPIQAVTGVNFRQGNGPGAQGVIAMIPGTAVDRESLFRTAQNDFHRAYGRHGTWGEIDRFYRDQALAYWRADPLRTLKLFGTKAYLFLTGRHYGDIYLPNAERAEGLVTRFALTPVQTPWLIPLALVALLVWLGRPRRYAPEIVLLAMPLVVAIAFWYSPRYRFPAVPVIAVGAAWAIVQGVQWRRQRRWTVGCIAAAVIAGGLTAVNARTGFDAPEVSQATLRNTLGVMAAAGGNLSEAVRQFRAALALKPGAVETEVGLADALRKQGQVTEALEIAERILAREPRFARAHNVRGIALMDQQRLDEALASFRTAVALDPSLGDAHCNLANVLSVQRNYDEAIAHYRIALAINPESAVAHFNLGLAQARAGDVAAAIESLRQALRFDPRLAPARPVLASLLVVRGEYPEAAALLRQAQRDTPDDVRVLNDLAWLLATCPSAELRGGAEAVRLARRACELAKTADPNLLDTLAAALAEAGAFTDAARLAEKAAQVADAAGNAGLAGEIRRRGRLYESQTPYREVPSP